MPKYPKFKDLRTGDQLYFLDPHTLTIKHLEVKEVTGLDNITRVTYYKVSEDLIIAYPNKDDVPTGVLLVDPNISLVLGMGKGHIPTVYAVNKTLIETWMKRG